jgi:hypothetical protein
MLRAVDVRADAAVLATIACHGLRPADDHAAGAPGDAPGLTPAQQDALQDAHMAHLAGLHEAGHLLAAGLCLTATHRFAACPFCPPALRKPAP